MLYGFRQTLIRDPINMDGGNDVLWGSVGLSVPQPIYIETWDGKFPTTVLCVSDDVLRKHLIDPEYPKINMLWLVTPKNSFEPPVWSAHQIQRVWQWLSEEANSFELSIESDEGERRGENPSGAADLIWVAPRLSGQIPKCAS